MPTHLVVVQATPFCNLACRYCYLDDKDSRARMSPDTVEGAFTSLAEAGAFAENVTVLWHAGEPLAAGVDYYQEALKRIRKAVPRGTAVRHSFQTNATLIDNRWVEFLQREDVSVGISIDGPAFLHDGFRIYRNGRGSFDATMAGLRRIRDSGKSFTVITVVTKVTLAHPRELLEFYLDEGITAVGFNPEEAEGVNNDSSLHGVDGFEQRYEEFLRAFHRHWKPMSHRIRVREFLQLEERILNPTLTRSSCIEPDDIVTIAHNGDYCTLSPELLGMKSAVHGNFVLGNLVDVGHAPLGRSEKSLKLEDELARGVEKCRRTCEYFRVCGGGYASNKVSEHGTLDSGETRHCRLAVKFPARIVLEDLEARFGRRPPELECPVP